GPTTGPPPRSRRRSASGGRAGSVRRGWCRSPAARPRAPGARDPSRRASPARPRPATRAASPAEAIRPPPRPRRGPPGPRPRGRPEQLVAGEGHDGCPRARVLPHGRLVREPEGLEIHHRPAPQILDQRDAVTVDQPRQLGKLRPRGEPRDAEVAGMDPQHRADPLLAREGTLVVLEMGAVRGADLEQGGAALLQDLGDAERP